MLADVIQIIAFEVAISGLVKVDDDRHDLAHTQLTLTVSMFTAFAQLALLPIWQKDLAKIIYIYEQLE
jgi:hypothetical protein